MTTAAAIAFTVIMGGLAVFQLALVAGAPLGRFAWGGQYRVLPAGKRVGSVVSVVLYALFTVVVLQRAGLVDALPTIFVDIGIWVLVAYFALGIIMNGASRSRPERYTMAPLTLVLAVLALLVALG
ncbi:MAG: hypothetical protein RJQ01_00970 [Microcella sp.]|uniref:hypothetical protein n=1 Tax=Microcella sp. TaxID=1913979 RepID=UPI0033160B0C